MSDKRAALRSRTFLKAEIDLMRGLSALSCVVKDISDAGARIMVSEGVVLPELFRIRLPKPDRWLDARVMWRHGELVGIQFDNVRQVPRTAETDDSARLRQLEAEVVRYRRMFEELRADPTRLHQILDPSSAM